MITTLTDTTASAIDKKMIEMRETFGATTLGRVLTLMIVAEGEDIDEPLEAAVHASHEHPCRVIVVDGRPDADSDGLDAEIRLGRDAGAGEIIILRARGAVLTSLDTLVIPLLLPDAPIVTWWPQSAPSSPAHDVLGAMSQRRITDASRARDPLAALANLRRGYSPGDSDLAWSRLTRWRGLLASALEIPPASQPTAATVTGDPSDPAVALLVSWLDGELGLETRQEEADGSQPDGCGLCGVRLHRADGDIVLHRSGPDAVTMRHGRDTTEQLVAMPQRSLYELLAEELRRLDPDSVYGEVLARAFPDSPGAAACALERPAARDRVFADADELASAAADDAARILRRAQDERGIAHLVLTGGRIGTATAGRLPAALAAAGVDAGRLHVWWGDGRFVPRGHADRSDAAVTRTLIAPLLEAGATETTIHRIPTASDGMTLAQAAARYGQQLDAAAGNDHPFLSCEDVLFDVLMLGVGPDAHVASLFPQHAAQKDITASAIPVEASPKPPAQRISLSWPVLAGARNVQLLATGAEKAEAVALGHGPIDPWRVPASAVRGQASTTWYLDPDSASQLPAEDREV